MVSYRRLAMRVLGHVPVPFGKKKAAPPPRVAAQRIAALALACAMMTGMALPAFAATYDIASGSIDIHATENGNLISQWFMNGEQKEYVSDSSGYIQDREDNEITITGTSTGNTVTIDADKDQTANVTLKDVNINVDEKYEHGYDPDQYKTAVEVTGSGNTNIELNGNNTLTSGYGHAGLEHNKTDDSGTLTIQDEKNDDGSAKGSASDTTGSLTATGGYHGAGIGGSDKHHPEHRHQPALLFLRRHQPDDAAGRDGHRAVRLPRGNIKAAISAAKWDVCPAKDAKNRQTTGQMRFAVSGYKTGNRRPSFCIPWGIFGRTGVFAWQGITSSRAGGR